jgi:hypothetical protein
MQDIIKGILKYQSKIKKDIVKHLEAVSDTPSVSQLFSYNLPKLSNYHFSIKA